MPAQLFAHVTWTTFERRPMIGPSEARFLERFLPGEAARHGCQSIAVGIVSDHVHLVLRLPTRFDLPRLAQGLKGASARLASLDSLTGLRWAKGYEAKTVSPSGLAKVVQYVRDQARRHPNRAIR